jgi:hypothetical protein
LDVVFPRKREIAGSITKQFDFIINSATHAVSKSAISNRRVAPRSTILGPNQ